MSNITFNLELNRKPNKEGLYEVFLRITENRKPSLVKTEVFTSPGAWGTFKKVIDTKGQVKEKRVLEWGKWVTRKDKDHAYKNSRLETKLNEYKKTYDKKKETDKYVSKVIVTNAVEQQYNIMDFIAYYDKCVKDMDNYNNSKGYGTTRGHLVNYLEKLGYPISEKIIDEKEVKTTQIDFRQIDPDFLKGFEKHLKAQDLDSDSQYTNLKRIRRVFNIAIEDKKSPVDKTIYPFDTYTMPTVKKNFKIKLSAEELERFEAQKYSNGTGIFDAQKAFLLSLRCAGIRVEDVVTLKVKCVTEGRITYQMEKGVTGGTIKSIKITPKIQKILDCYITKDSKPEDFIFPFFKTEEDHKIYAERNLDKEKNRLYKSRISSKTTIINGNLKLIASDAKIEKNVSTHIARHSWSAIAKKKTKDVKAIQEALGHSSLEITMGYLEELDLESQDTMMSEVDI